MLLGDAVSRQHGIIAPENGAYRYTNLGRNGTILAGRNIRDHRLQAGDILRIADWELQFLTTDTVPTTETIVQKRTSNNPTPSHTLVGDSAAIKTLREQISRIAHTAAPVCITGETGSGKEVVAHAIHAESTRSQKPFVAVNCGAIPASMIESELFGYERGAFTGAVRDHRGYFEQANGGTIFLDEIGELPLELQTRFLRVLETGSFRRIGSQSNVTADFRIICATHRNLQQAIKEGTFREDLFFRLFVLPLNLPPLRNRTGDIPLLVAHFSTLFGRTSVNWSEEAMAKLIHYSWPGNVRELKNTVQRALVLATHHTIGENDISLLQSNTAAPCTGNMADHERAVIMSTLQQHGGNKTQTAATLGISRTTLIAKIKRYNIELSESY